MRIPDAAERRRILGGTITPERKKKIPQQAKLHLKTKLATTSDRRDITLWMEGNILLKREEEPPLNITL